MDLLSFSSFTATSQFSSPGACALSGSCGSPVPKGYPKKTSQFSSEKPALAHHHHHRHLPTSPFPFSFKPITPSSPKFSPLRPTLKSSKTLTPIPQLAAPQTPATSVRGAETDAMGLLLRERIVFLGNSIDDFVADAIISQLLLLDAQDPTKDIRLFINCPGGSLRADVSTVALGIAASTASIILGGGTKGKRLAMPNTRVMIHQPLGGASGQAIDNNIIRIVAGFTGRTIEQVRKDIDRDRYMSPIEAVEYGIIDGVIDRDSIIPLAPVPERVTPTLNYEDMRKDPMKFLNPDVPDDEIY
ncbi:ATP-dependent Clp protease proteolytic [Salix suchowensis]|nr:ATP-dependent Clp protease proteolytic [Salix suchowensis]